MNHAGEITPLTQHGAPACRDHHHVRAGAPRAVRSARRRSRRRRRRSSRAWSLAARRSSTATTAHFDLLDRRARRMPADAIVSLRRARRRRECAATASEPEPSGSQVTAVLSDGTRRAIAVGAPGVHLARTRWPWSRRSMRSAWLEPARAPALARRRPRRRVAARARRCTVSRRHRPADRRELQRQSGLDAGGACGAGHGPRDGLRAPDRGAGRHAGTRTERPANCTGT